jgi:hypothetical protein
MEWTASRPGRFTPKERAPGTPWIGGWVGPRAVLDAVVKRKIPGPHRKSKPRTPIVQPVAQKNSLMLDRMSFSNTEADKQDQILILINSLDI